MNSIKETLNSVLNVPGYFLKAHTEEQKKEASSVCSRGLSENFFESRIQAFLQSLTLLAVIAKDIPAAPIQGIRKGLNSVRHITLKQGLEDISAGFKAGLRSIAQLVAVTGAVAVGIFFPAFVYSRLDALNKAPEAEKKVIEKPLKSSGGIWPFNF